LALGEDYPIGLSDVASAPRILAIGDTHIETSGRGATPMAGSGGQRFR
jgi:hypothetical protein